MNYYVSVPPQQPYLTTFLDESFPKHHHLFEGTRHRIDTALQTHHDQYIHTPRVDVRETAERFYIDIELPGLADKDALALKWNNSKNLFVEASITRPLIDGSPKEKAVDKSTANGADSQKIHNVEGKVSEEPVHLVVRERGVGQFDRAFQFPVEVDHDTLVAKLQYGLLRITVVKKESDQLSEKRVEVVHVGM